MEKFSLKHFAFYAALLLSGPCLATSVTTTGAGIASSGGSYDPSTVAWVNAVATAGCSVTTTQEGRIDTLIRALKTASIWTTIDRLWILNGECTAESQIDLVNLATWTASSAGTITGPSTSTGMHGDGTASFLNTNFDPATAVSPNFTTHSGTLGVYVLTSRTSFATFDDIGAFNSGGQFTTYIQPYAAAGVGVGFNWNINDANNNGDASSPGNAQGNWLATRTSSTVTASYGPHGLFLANGSSSADFGTVVDGPIYIFAAGATYAGPNVGTGFSTDALSAAVIAGGWNSTQATAFESALNAYMTAWGINVY